MKKYLVYNDEMVEFLKENARYYTIKQLVKILKEEFDIEFDNRKLATYCNKHYIKYKFEKPNKSHSNKPTQLGAIINKTDGDYLKVKTSNHKWEYLQRKIYEDNYNVKLPQDVYVIFLDQNRRNFNIKNLKAISRRSSAIMSKDELFSKEPKITKLGILNSKLKIKSKEAIND